MMVSSGTGGCVGTLVMTGTIRTEDIVVAAARQGALPSADISAHASTTRRVGDVPRFAVGRAQQLLGINGLSSTLCLGRISGRNTQQAIAGRISPRSHRSLHALACRPSYYIAVLGRVTHHTHFTSCCLFAVGTHVNVLRFPQREVFIAPSIKFSKHP